jgi:hypothetical protein
VNADITTLTDTDSSQWPLQRHCRSYADTGRSTYRAAAGSLAEQR